MLSNQIIGIIGVFVLTFFLIALYHLIGKIGAHSKRYIAPAKQLNKWPQDRRTVDLKKSSSKDNAWLLWTSDREDRASPSKSNLGEHS